MDNKIIYNDVMMRILRISLALLIVYPGLFFKHTKEAEAAAFYLLTIYADS